MSCSSAAAVLIVSFPLQVLQAVLLRFLLLSRRSLPFSIRLLFVVGPSIFLLVSLPSRLRSASPLFVLLFFLNLLMSSSSLRPSLSPQVSLSVAFGACRWFFNLLGQVEDSTPASSSSVFPGMFCTLSCAFRYLLLLLLLSIFFLCFLCTCPFHTLSYLHADMFN